MLVVRVPAYGTVDAPPFRVGDRVRLKSPPPKADPAYWTGTVAAVPEAGAPVVHLAGHRLGMEVSVTPDKGDGVFVADASDLEAA